LNTVPKLTPLPKELYVVDRRNTQPLGVAMAQRLLQRHRAFVEIVRYGGVPDSMTGFIPKEGARAYIWVALSDGVIQTQACYVDRPVENLLLAGSILAAHYDELFCASMLEGVGL